MFGLLEGILFLFAGTRLLLIAAAVIPAIFLVIRVYRRDRLEKESRGLMLRLLFLGILSTYGAYIGETIGSYVLDFLTPAAVSESFRYFLYYLLVVGFVEEGCKYFVMKKATWHSSEFNCLYDGILYAATTSLGFALAENITYTMNYGLSTALVRAVTAIPGHACFGVFMGVWYGLAREAENRGRRETSRARRRLAFVIPAIIHGLYDVLASSTGRYGDLLFVGFIVLLFLSARSLVITQSGRDRYI